MSYIIRRKVKNAVYVYECTSYRNKAGKPRSRQKYLGKLDSDGVLITKKRKLPAQIREVKTITRRFILEPVKSPKVQTQTQKSGRIKNYACLSHSAPQRRAKSRLDILSFSFRAAIVSSCLELFRALRISERTAASVFPDFSQFGGLKTWPLS